MPTRLKNTTDFFATSRHNKLRLRLDNPLPMAAYTGIQLGRLALADSLVRAYGSVACFRTSLVAAERDR